MVHISATRYPIEMEFESKCNILNGQVIYIEKSKLNIIDMSSATSHTDVIEILVNFTKFGTLN